MPRMTSYRHGVPAWADVSSPDVEGTGGFYCDLFGWDISPDMGPEAGGYRLFFQDGARVGGIGPNNDAPPAWTTYICVSDVDAASGRVGAAGGTVAVAPMDLPNDSGRISFAVDPAGGFFGLFQAGPNHPGAELVNEPVSVVWNELNVRDPATVMPFYESLLGWTTSPMDDSPEPYLIINVEGRAVAGVMTMGDQFPEHVPTHWLTYFAVADAQATADRCAAAGGTVVMPPFDTPVGTMAVLLDPTGAIFAVGTMVQADDPNNWGG